MKKTLKILLGYGELTEGLGFEAVTRNPLANEPYWLNKLGIAPEDCRFCDVIWIYQDRLIFTDFSSEVIENQKPRVLYKFDPLVLRGGDVFTVLTLQYPLETRHIAKGLEFLAGLLSSENEFIKSRPAETVQITGRDVCV